MGEYQVRTVCMKTNMLVCVEATEPYVHTTNTKAHRRRCACATGRVEWRRPAVWCGGDRLYMEERTVQMAFRYQHKRGEVPSRRARSYYFVRGYISVIITDDFSVGTIAEKIRTHCVSDHFSQSY